MIPTVGVLPGYCSAMESLQRLFYAMFTLNLGLWRLPCLKIPWPTQNVWRNTSLCTVHGNDGLVWSKIKEKPKQILRFLDYKQPTTIIYNIFTGNVIKSCICIYKYTLYSQYGLTELKSFCVKSCTQHNDICSAVVSLMDTLQITTLLVLAKSCKVNILRV